MYFKHFHVKKSRRLLNFQLQNFYTSRWQEKEWFLAKRQIFRLCHSYLFTYFIHFVHHYCDKNHPEEFAVAKLYGNKKKKLLTAFSHISFVLTKTSNHLKPPRNCINHLKPAILQYFLLKISYSQVEFVLILCTKVFLGQIWSEKLKFSKLTKIWYTGTLLHPYFNISKIFLTHVFWANLVP